MDTATDESDQAISIAVSGGGHRASAWALGVFQSVITAELGPSITSVTSVSGGSISNAVVADRVDLHKVSRIEFDRATADLRDIIASEGLFFPGPHSNRYVNRTFALFCFFFGMLTAIAVSIFSSARGHSSGWWLLAGSPLLVVGIVVRFRSEPVAGVSRWLLVAGCAVACGGYLGSSISTNANGGVLAARGVALMAFTAFVGWLVMVQLGRRGQAVVAALDKSLFQERALAATGGGDTPPSVNHIFSTTDLESADALYLAPRFVASYRRGIAPSEGISLAEAVQASAALPVAFPPSMLKLTNDFERPWTERGPAKSLRDLPLSDGGVYGNMADQWDARRSQRLMEWGDLVPAGVGPEPTLLIVANASAPWEWEPWIARTRFGREFQSLKRNQGIQYDQTTAVRRSVLFTRFERTLRTNVGLLGVTLMIDRSPFQVCDPHITDPDAGVRSRAIQARQTLARKAGCGRDGCEHTTDRDCPGRATWRAVTKYNSSIPTTLGPIGTTATDSIMTHARTATAAYLWVLHGLADPEQFEAPPTLPEKKNT